jgi:hypothetical protein
MKKMNEILILRGIKTKKASSGISTKKLTRNHEIEVSKSGTLFTNLIYLVIRSSLAAGRKMDYIQTNGRGYSRKDS